jgi:AcrR family transcriptional regulator
MLQRQIWAREEIQFEKKLQEGVGLVGGVSEVARICGVTRQTVYRWLKAKEKPFWAAQVGVIALLREVIEEKARRLEREKAEGGRFLRLQRERQLARSAGRKSKRQQTRVRSVDLWKRE